METLTVFDYVWISLFVFALIVIYFLPAIAALARRHEHPGAVFFLNLVMGWTLIGWIATFIWAFVGQRKNNL